MATHPVLVGQLQAPLTVALEEALASHRYALGLDQDNADTIFNTAQVLTSMGEETFKDDSASDASAVRYLKEALELLQRCIILQESHYTEFQQQLAEALSTSEQAGDGGVMHLEQTHEPQGSTDAGTAQERWVSVIEPVTKDTLIDTIIASLSTMTTLCGILGSSSEALGAPSLAWVEEYSSSLLDARLPALLQSTDRVEEVAIGKAIFISALLEAGYRSSKLDVHTYRRERDVAFSGPPIPTSSAGLMANAASLVAFNSALSETESPPAATADLASMRWNTLGTAISNLAAASMLSSTAPEDVAKTHLLRGDASLLQYQLSKPPISFAPALKSASALLKNAEVFYRNTSKLTHDEEERDKCKIQEAIVMSLQGNNKFGRAQLETIVAVRGDQYVRDHIDEMFAEGLLADKDVQNIGFS